MGPLIVIALLAVFLLSVWSTPRWSDHGFIKDATWNKIKTFFSIVFAALVSYFTFAVFGPLLGILVVLFFLFVPRPIGRAWSYRHRA